MIIDLYVGYKEACCYGVEKVENSTIIVMESEVWYFIRNQQIVKETIGVGVNEKAVLRFYQTALSFTSISIFPWWTKSRPFRHHLWEFNLCSLL